MHIVPISAIILCYLGHLVSISEHLPLQGASMFPPKFMNSCGNSEPIRASAAVNQGHRPQALKKNATIGGRNE